jgi:hypothetical protein
VPIVLASAAVFADKMIHDETIAIISRGLSLP